MTELGRWAAVRCASGHRVAESVPIRSMPGPALRGSRLMDAPQTVGSQALTPDFGAVFEAAPGLYLGLSPDFRIVAVSDAYTRATMTKREAIVGRWLFDVFPDNPDDPTARGASSVRASLEMVLRHRVPHVMAVVKYDIRRPESQGGGFEERYWSPVNSPVFGPDGELTYILNYVEDVTEKVRLERLGLEQQAQKMEALGRLAGGVAHDFNNLLGVIRGYGELLARGLGEMPRLTKYVNQMIEATDRAAALTGQLLAFSRKQVLEPRVLDLNSVVSEREKLLRRLIGEDVLLDPG